MIKKIFILIFVAFGCNAYAQQVSTCPLFPQQNGIRNLLSLSGVWNFKVDSLNVGEKENWFNGLSNTKPIAVPASWNEQYDELRDYLGYAWYEQNSFVPKTWKGQKIFLRFGSASYAAKIWLNGKYIGSHEGAHLPFAFDITNFINWDAENKVSVQVENILKPERVAPGDVKSEGHFKNYPAGNYDFFPYCGLQRDVFIYSVPNNAIDDVTVTTNIQQQNGIVNISIKKNGNAKAGKIVLTGNNKTYEQAFSFNNSNQANIAVTVDNARLWSCEDPYLYQLNISLIDNKKTVDVYNLNVGIRTIKVTNKQILLNDKPVVLKGFGKHEDFPVLGKGTSNAVIVKDYSLLKWIGANSFRTSHYPYDEAYLEMADKLGFLVIDETPAVGLVFEKTTDLINKRKATCKQQIEEMIARDKNHPSVIMWSVANEPGLGSSYLKKDVVDSVSYNFFKELIALSKTLDNTRPSTFVLADNGPYMWMNLVDVICINRYFGWYSNHGRIDEGARMLNKELDKIFAQFNKPIFITEFGADAQAGLHSLNPEMFTEEYQMEFIKAYVEVAATKDFVCGTHVWAFADFKTSQGDKRFGGINWKGVFTRDRKPKMAAHYLQSVWNK